MKYSQEFKTETITAYFDRTTSASDFLSGANVPKSSFYGWLRKHNTGQEKKREPKFTKAEYNHLQTRIANLECKIEILKAVNCSVHSSLKDRLVEIERLQGQYSVHLLCDALSVSRETFYNHIKRNKRDNAWFVKRREDLRIKVQEVYEESGRRFGSEKITAIRRSRGETVSPKMVSRLMQDMGISSVRNSSKQIYDNEQRGFFNRVHQNFDPDAPNKIWVSDVTAFKYNDHFYYICAVMDLYSRKIIGYEISKRNSTQLVKTTIRHAAESRAFSDDLIFHSDRGANFTAAATREYLHSLHIRQSFSRPGNPHDNAVMESFFATLKREELYRIEYRSEREFKAAVGAYITFYNSKRPHRKLKNRTPDAWEAEYRCKTKESKDS